MYYKFWIKLWSECVYPAAHLELHQFSDSGWKKCIRDLDLTLRLMKCSMTDLLP